MFINIRRKIHLTLYMRPTIILYFLVLSNLLQAVVNTEPQQNVNFNRYLGRWYEQARFENWFEEGMEHVYTDYLPLQNGAIQVINHGTSAQGYAEQARGRAFIAGKGVLDISFTIKENQLIYQGFTD